MSDSTRQSSDAPSSPVRITRAGSLLALLLSAGNSQLGAQLNLGQLSEIRGSRDKQACAVTGTGIPDNPVRVNSGAAWRPLNPTFPREQLRVNDKITVRREVDARVVIDEPSGMGADITLAPKLVCSFMGVDLSAGVPADSGAYELARHGDTVVFTVNRGAAYIQWTDPRKRCLLHVIAGVVRPVLARVCGTQLVVSVDATGNNGYLYVREGTVLVTGQAVVVQANAGQLVRLGGRANVALADGSSALHVDLAEINYHSQEVWNGHQGFWSRPSTYIWGGIVGGATAVVVNKLLSNQNVTARNVGKTVVIHIPL